MELVLKRKYYKSNYIIGKLYGQSIDNSSGKTPMRKALRYICDTLEPKDAGLKASMTDAKIKKEKRKAGACAIPPSRYPVVITKSYKFKRWLPQLVNVRGFDGIRIHAGNTPADTQGCILTGYNTRKGMVTGSQMALTKLIKLLMAAYDKGEVVWITICR